MSRLNNYSVPVITYHSVGPNVDGWAWPELTASLEVFESQMSALATSGYQAITLDDLYSYMMLGKEIPTQAVVLTFDDGYLDNYVYAFPILKKYGFKATIFMPTEFVDPLETPRKTLDDVWNGMIAMHDLPSPGFLSWAEMRLMESSELIQIESHSTTHTWHPSSERIIDFYSPESNYPWMTWNRRPDLKYSYLPNRLKDVVALGEPVYEHKRAFAGPKYTPDQRLADHLVSIVRDGGEDSFFRRADFKDKLFAAADSFRQKYGDNGMYETHEDFLLRVRSELVSSKKLLQDQLGHDVKFLNFPGGVGGPEVAKIAIDEGYLSVARDADLFGGTPNVPFADASWFRRIPCLDTWCMRGRAIAQTDAEFLIRHIKLFQGDKSQLLPIRAKKISWLIRYGLFGYHI